MSECEKMAVLYPGHAEILQEIEYIQAKADTYELEDKQKKIKAREETERQLSITVGDLIIKGKIEVRKNAFDKAIDIYYEALRLDPRNAELKQIIEATEILKNKFEYKALEEKEKMFEKKKIFQQYISEGDKEYIYGNYELAIQCYEKALDMDPDNMDIRRIIKEAGLKIREINQEELKKKTQVREKINALNLEAVKLYFEKKYEQALEICEQILIYEPTHNETILLKKQVLEIKNLEDSKAEEKHNLEAVKKETINHTEEIQKQNLQLESRNVYQAGLEYLRKNEPEKAIQEWEKIQFIDPNNSFILDEIRHVKLKIKQREMEEFQKNEFKRENEMKANQHWIEGRKFFREEMYDQALENFETAILLVGREKHLVEELDKTQMQISKRKTDGERVRLYEEKRRKSLSHYLFMATRHFNNGQYQQALEYYQKALDIDPENVEIKNGILNAEAFMQGPEKIVLEIGDDSELQQSEQQESFNKDFDHDENSK